MGVKITLMHHFITAVALLSIELVSVGPCPSQVKSAVSAGVVIVSTIDDSDEGVSVWNSNASQATKEKNDEHPLDQPLVMERDDIRRRFQDIPNGEERQCSWGSWKKIGCWFSDTASIAMDGLLLRDRLYKAYEMSLAEFTVVTKSVTAAAVSMLADCIAQIIEHNHACTTRNRSFNWNRSFSVSAESFFVSAPVLHFAYEWMDEHLSGPESELGSWCWSILQILIDVFVLDSIFVATMMLTSALLQGGWHRIALEMRQDYYPSVRVAWAQSLAMAPLQFVNFWMIPVRFRVLFTNLEDLVWTAGVSFMIHQSRD